MIKKINDQITASIEAKRCIPAEAIEKLVKRTVAAYKDGKKTIFMGNGGSAADAQHLAGEFVARFLIERPGIPSLALHTNTSTMTAWANDYDYSTVYQREIEAFAQEGDVVIGISTSGNSKNIILALDKAKEMGCFTVGLTGNDGGKMKNHCELLVNVPVSETPRIQEAHILIGHIFCGLVEEELFG